MLNIPYFYKERRKLISQIFKEFATIIIVTFVAEQIISENLKLEIILWGLIAALLCYGASVHSTPKE